MVLIYLSAVIEKQSEYIHEIARDFIRIGLQHVRINEKNQMKLLLNEYECETFIETSKPMQ